MLTMSQINHIKDLSNCGYRISEISKKRKRQIFLRISRSSSFAYNCSR